MSRIYILILSVISFISLGFLYLYLSAPVETDLKNRLIDSRRVLAFRINENSKLIFNLLPTDKEIDIETNLEVESSDPDKEYTYGIRVEVLRGDEVVMEQIFYKQTRKTVLFKQDDSLPYEPVFYFGSGLTPTDTRSTTIILKENTLPGSYLRISLMPESSSKSAIVRVGRVIYRSQIEALQAWQRDEEERGQSLEEVADQSEKEAITRTMKRTVEWLSPEGIPDIDYSQVDLYISNIASVPPYDRKLIVGTLLGAFQGAVYKAKPGDKIRINGTYHNGSLLSQDAIKIDPPITLAQPVIIVKETTYTVINRIDQPVYIQFETYSEKDELWVASEPIYSISRYYLIGPNMRHKIVANLSNSPRRIRVVTRAHFTTNEYRSVEYRVSFRGFNSAGEIVIDDQYTAQSTFEPLDRYIPEEIYARGEAVGTRHVAYIYLPANTVTLQLDSDRSILVALSTEIEKNWSYLSLSKLRDKVQDGISETPMTHWFYFRPSNVQELLDTEQYRLVAAASMPRTLKPALVGLVPKRQRLSLEGLETVSLRPEKNYFVEIFEPITSKRRDQKWESNLYTPLDPLVANLNITNQNEGQTENDRLRLRYRLDGLRKLDESPLIIAGGEKISAAGHTPVGKIAFKKNGVAPIVVERAVAGDRYFINRPSGSLTEIWSERTYFNLLPGQPLSVTIEQKLEKITGVNLILRFDRSQATPPTVKLQVTVEAEDGRIVRPPHNYSVKNIEDKQAILSNRPDEQLSAAQRIFIPLNREISPGRYKITVELLDSVKAYARFFHYTSAQPASPKGINFWVESNE